MAKNETSALQRENRRLKIIGHPSHSPLDSLWAKKTEREEDLKMGATTHFAPERGTCNSRRLSATPQTAAKKARVEERKREKNPRTKTWQLCHVKSVESGKKARRENGSLTLPMSARVGQ